MKATAMQRSLRHRGPDDRGVWTDADAGLALAHRRLAILDPTDNGHQPMASASGRVVVTFNGELYNFREIGERLGVEGASIRTGCDTEVLVEALDRWGPGRTLDRLEGMFAFASWDRDSRRLLLARDRLGEKPLYYGLCDGLFVFASELKAVEAAVPHALDVDRDALAWYLLRGHVPSPLSIYGGIAKLPAGTSVTLRHGDRTPRAPERYWSLPEVARAGQDAPLELTDTEAVTQLERVLGAAVARQMVADVPLGAFLSGGIDSSLVVALMQAHSARPVATFTMGFHEHGFDEAPHARRIAAHLGTDHHDLYVTAAEAREVIPRLSEIYDEPFGDSSQIPMVLLAGFARQHVTVALSGDGGDEIFAGYNRHLAAAALARRLRAVPARARRWTAALLRSATAAIGRHPRATTWLTLRSGLPQPLDKAGKLAVMLEARDAVDAYDRLVTAWPEGDGLVIGGSTARGLPLPVLGSGLADLEAVLLADSLGYLPDDILTKVDRATMAASLETRVPFLDRRVVEWAWQLPTHFKIRGSTTKWLVRQLLARYVPARLYDRPKSGFAVPVGEWLRGPLRPWAEDLLAPERLRRQNLLQPEPIRDVWRSHLHSGRDRSAALWPLLVFLGWLEDREARILAGPVERSR